MRLAAYNTQNLFLRARALNQDTWAEGRDALALHSQLNGILNKDKYTPGDKKKIVQLMKDLGIDKKDDGGEFAILRQNRGKLIKRPKGQDPEVVAGGRDEWIGWVDLKVEQVDEESTRNTARVIRDIDADVIAIVEAESRPALVRFNEDLMPAVNGSPYQHVMLIDGNDDRGIDVGIMLTRDSVISSMLSHVDDVDGTGRIFSRDCAEYTVRAPSGGEMVVLINHFKSKGFGDQGESNRKRERQARRVQQIYADLVAKGVTNVAVVGDFNDTPGSAPLAPLLQQTDLKDISEHPTFDNGGRPGTFGNATASLKIDYLLLSPALFSTVRAGGIFRKGVWGGKNGDLFEHYPEITKQSEAASDHGVIWAEFAL